MEELAAAKATKQTMQQIKQTLQNKVLKKEQEIERLQCLKRKQQQNTHNPKINKKLNIILNTHCTGMSSNIYHDTNIASSSTLTRENVHVDESSVNTEIEHLVMAKSDSLTTVRNLMRELDAVKTTKKILKQRKPTLQKIAIFHKDGHHIQVVIFWVDLNY